MKKEFKLLKKYPDSIPVGTIITFSSYDAEGFCYGSDDSGQVRIEDVREFPEFWEEIKNEITYTPVATQVDLKALEEKVKQLEDRVITLESRSNIFQQPYWNKFK